MEEDKEEELCYRCNIDSDAACTCKEFCGHLFCQHYDSYIRSSHEN